MVEFTRPYLYPKQLDAIFCPERYALVEASTKSGKTVGCIAWLLEQGMKGKPGQNFWWVAPGYNQAEIAYRRMKQGLTKGSYVAMETPTPRLQLVSGSIIWFKSADNPDALYGEDVYGAVVDEASRVSEGSWHAVRSTLTATRGPVRIIGNVKGRRNWFWNLARQAETGLYPNMHYAKITADDAVKSGVLDAEEIEDARRTLPEFIFKELYYAEPGDDAGNPFGESHIEACTTAELLPGEPVAYGLDLAKKKDYLVLIGLNEYGGVCHFSRWRGLPWGRSIRAIWKIVGEDVPCMVDSTGVGDPVLEELQFEHGNFFGYTFTATSKQKLMEGLAVSIQKRELRFPKGHITEELMFFEYEDKPSGVRYSAPAGRNDDCVMALGLARQMWQEQVPGQSVSKFYEMEAGRLRREVKFDPDHPDNPRPWHTDAAPAYDLDNELTELYNKTVQNLMPSFRRICVVCGKKCEGQTTISDGVLHWHPECNSLTSTAYYLPPQHLDTVE